MRPATICTLCPPPSPHFHQPEQRLQKYHHHHRRRRRLTILVEVVWPVRRRSSQTHNCSVPRPSSIHPCHRLCARRAGGPMGSHMAARYTASPCGSAQHAPMSEDVQADRASANRCCFSAQRWLATPPQSCAHGHRLRNGTAPSQQAHVAQMQSRILERLRPSS